MRLYRNRAPVRRPIGRLNFKMKHYKNVVRWPITTDIALEPNVGFQRTAEVRARGPVAV